MQAESNGDEYYTRSPNVIRQSKKLSASAKLVYQSLLYFAGDKLECFPKEETIAQDTGLTAKTVRGAIGELVAHKLISQERMEHLRGKPKGYRLHVIPAEFTGAEAVRLPAMLADRRQERQAVKEERPGQAPNPLDHWALSDYREITGHKPNRELEEAIVNEVTDRERWRHTLEYCKGKYPGTLKSRKLIRAYDEGWSGDRVKPQTQEATRSGGIIVNDDWERQLRKRGILGEEGVSSGTAPPRAARLPVKSEIPTGGNGGAFSRGQISVVNQGQ